MEEEEDDEDSDEEGLHLGRILAGIAISTPVGGNLDLQKLYNGVEETLIFKVQ